MMRKQKKQKNFRSRKEAIEDMQRKEEFIGLDADDQKEKHEQEMIKDHRRRKGILRKEQLELMNPYNEERISNITKTQSLQRYRTFLD